MEQANLTVTLTVVVKPEPGITTEDKEAFIKQQMIDQAAALANNYDYGITVTGTVTSSASQDETVDHSKPDFEG